jgi:hypothetical protein
MEQTSAGELADVELLPEVYGSPTATTVEENHVTVLWAECKPGDTWAECPQKVLERLSCPLFSSFVARMASSCRMAPLMSWLKVQL